MDVTIMYELLQHRRWVLSDSHNTPLLEGSQRPKHEIYRTSTARETETDETLMEFGVVLMEATCWLEAQSPQ